MLALLFPPFVEEPSRAWAVFLVLVLWLVVLLVIAAAISVCLLIRDRRSKRDGD